MLGLRLGFFLGFLGGAIVSSLLSRPQDSELAEQTTESVVPAEGGVVGKVKTKLREARQAAREEAALKERQMRREFDQTVHRSG